jgi:hypothetical protein
MLRLAAIVLAAGALSACALPVQRTPRAMGWGVSASAEDGAKLVLGNPDTDEMRVTMTCRPLSGRVELTLLGWRGDPAVVELSSGKVTGRYAGAAVQDDEVEGALDIQLRLPADDPVLSRLADTGELGIVLPTKRRLRLPNAFSQAHDFLRVCRAR